MELFGTTRGMEGGGGAKRALLPNICHTYPTVMKLGTVIVHVNHVTNPFISADISIFSSEISKFCYIREFRYRLRFGKQILIL